MTVVDNPGALGRGAECGRVIFRALRRWRCWRGEIARDCILRWESPYRDCLVVDEEVLRAVEGSNLLINYWTACRLRQGPKDRHLLPRAKGQDVTRQGFLVTAISAGSAE